MVVRAMDGEVRPTSCPLNSSFALGDSLWFQIATELYLKLHFIQAICFPGLDEHERAHFLCALRRLNTIAEVQTTAAVAL